MSEMHPVVVWLVVLVLGLQLVEFLLRVSKGVAARFGRAPAYSGRARFVAMTPLEKIETFRLGELDHEGLELFMDVVELPEAERQRIAALLGMGRALAPGRQAEVTLALAPVEPGLTTAEVLALPTSKAALPPPKSGPRELSVRS